jgi:hypothetical protein
MAAAAAADSDPAAAVAAMSTCAHWSVLALPPNFLFPSPCPPGFPVPLVHVRRRVGDALDLVDLDLSWGEPRFGRGEGLL